VLSEVSKHSGDVLKQRAYMAGTPEKISVKNKAEPAKHFSFFLTHNISRFIISSRLLPTSQDITVCSHFTSLLLQDHNPPFCFTMLSRRLKLPETLLRVRKKVAWLLVYEGLPIISENLNIPRKPLALRTCAARCVLMYLSTFSQPTGVFISARVSEFWLFSLHNFHVCLLISKWRMLRSKEFALKFTSSSTKLHLKPTEC